MRSSSWWLPGSHASYISSASWTTFLWNSYAFVQGNYQSFGHGWASQCGRLLPVLNANRLLPAILVLAGAKPGWIFVEDSAAVPWTQHRRTLFCITWLFISGLWFFLLPTCFQVSEWKLCCVCSLVMFWEKRNFGGDMVFCGLVAFFFFFQSSDSFVQKLQISCSAMR